MPEKYIPEYIDPFRHAEQGLSLEGIINMVDMPRLQATVFNDQSSVAARMQFGIDEQGIRFVKGQLQTTLFLQCQRCMEALSYEIIADFALGIVHTLDEANALPEGYEPVLAIENNLALRELIEDEILLNLPIIPRHDPEVCKVKLPLTDSGWEQGKGNNPFHVLASLKHDKKGER